MCVGIKALVLMSISGLASSMRAWESEHVEMNDTQSSQISEKRPLPDYFKGCSKFAAPALKEFRKYYKYEGEPQMDCDTPGWKCDKRKSTALFGKGKDEGGPRDCCIKKFCKPLETDIQKACGTNYAVDICVPGTLVNYRCSQKKNTKGKWEVDCNRDKEGNCKMAPKPGHGWISSAPGTCCRRMCTDANR
eukprot:TRINITY_DN3766_c0_g1_i1.p2 TRINITY_DN3766_c0_g1~~TRINITY_DN3766_c0_g1_i1.p2  ORF type:complete len:191 (+),score=31.20 TRINITY_DN3766_c0_g1_i1:108-680(+)